MTVEISLLNVYLYWTPMLLTAWFFAAVEFGEDGSPVCLIPCLLGAVWLISLVGFLLSKIKVVFV